MSNRKDNTDETHSLNTVSHGLIVLDPDTLNEGMVDIVHFCGYWSPPTQDDINHLKEELKTDEEFGLTEIADRLIIQEATPETVDMYCRPPEE